MTGAPSSQLRSRAGPSDSLARLAVGITVVGVIVVLYFTLFPFDFVDQGRTPGDIVRRFSLSSSTPWTLREAPANILLTIPLGFGLGGIVSIRTASTRTIVLIALIGTLVVSSAVELAQSAWLLRDPSVNDIVANAAGGAVGAWLWTKSEPALHAIRRRDADAAAPGARRVFWFVVALLPIVAIPAITIASRHSTELAGWDRRFPLVLGNEATGNRPWQGSISQLALADRAFTSEEIAGLLDGARMSEIAPRSTVVDHDFGDGSRVPAGWSVRGAETPSGAALPRVGRQLGPDRWIQTDEPADRISRRLDGANSFTLFVDATSASPSQGGPARLVSLSSDPHHTNLMIGQEGSDLVVRVRTRFTGNNGISPEFVLPDVFQNDRSRRFIVTYRPSSVGITVDQVGDTKSIALLPETVPLVATFTDEVNILRFSVVGNTVRALFFATILFAPWTVCVASLAFPRQRQRDGQVLALVIIPIVLVEALLAWTLPGESLRAGLVLATAATAATAALIAFAIRRTAARDAL